MAPGDLPVKFAFFQKLGLHFAIFNPTTMKLFSLIIFLWLSMLCHSACNSHQNKNAQTQDPQSDSIDVKLELITDDIEMPIECQVVQDQRHRIFITDNAGSIRIMKMDSLLPVPFLDLRTKQVKKDKASPIGSINSVAFHPEFAKNGKLFVCYNASSKFTSHPGKLVIASFTASMDNADIADPLSEKTVLELEGKNIIANGAMIGFGPDGFLYISIGDDAIGDSNYVYHAQDLDHFNGKILRIDVNKDPYGIPPDNPFISVKNARPEIYAYGFRKMWRFSFDPITKKMFGGDVGEIMEEEIDIVEKGGNYGWPVKEGDSSFQKNNIPVNASFISPIHNYPRTTGICVIGGSFYTGSELPLLKGRYFFSDFNGSLYALQPSDDGKYSCKGIKILNKPAQEFFISGTGVDENNELVIMGFLIIEGKGRGVMYRVVKA